MTDCPAKELNIPLVKGEMVRIEKILYTEAVFKDLKAASKDSQTLPKAGQDLRPHVVNHPLRNC